MYPPFHDKDNVAAADYDDDGNINNFQSAVCFMHSPAIIRRKAFSFRAVRKRMLASVRDHYTKSLLTRYLINRL